MPSLNPMLARYVSAFLRTAIWPYRQASSWARVLPDFIIIGAQKSGTSSLYSYLAQHPQLLPSLGKEVHFFDGGMHPRVDSFEKGQAWYRAHFALKKHLGMHRKAFEASPLYLFNPLAPKRIADLVPNAKLVAILRNPTERAISHYFHEKAKGRESLPIMDALHAEERRLAPAIAESDYKRDAFRNHSYKARGLYKVQIERYLNYFPMDNLLVTSSEAFFAEPASFLRRVFGFVGVDARCAISDLRPRNVATNKSKVEPAVYEYLNDYFRAPNEALYELIGEDYGW